MGISLSELCLSLCWNRGKRFRASTRNVRVVFFKAFDSGLLYSFFAKTYTGPQEYADIYADRLTKRLTRKPTIETSANDP